MGYLFSQWGRTHSALLELQPGRRAYFRVTQPAAAAKMRGWQERRETAEQEIAAYLRKVSPVLGGETPFYKVDETGRVRSINFRFGMGFTHTGWKGVDGTNWLEPESEQVIRELKALSPLPSYAELNEMIGWPEPCREKMFADRHKSGYDEFAERALRSIRLTQSGEDLYLSVPFPETFAAYPPLQQAVEAWRPPSSLEQISETEGRAMERRHSLANHPAVTAFRRVLSFA